MGKLRKRLGRLTDRLGGRKLRLEVARRRAKSFRERAEREHNRQLEHQKKADHLRKTAPAKAARHDRIGLRCQHRAERSSAKAIYWKGQIKTHVQAIESLETNVEAIEAEIRKIESSDKVKISGNKATGGNPGKRWIAYSLQMVRNCANGHRRNFYSQGGSWDVTHEISPGPSYTDRSDCSSTVTGIAWGCGLDDPNGEDFHAGFTGTLISEAGGWHQTDLAGLKAKGWGYIVYGSGVGHHTEAYCPSPSNSERTVGHGSGPVDFGTVFLFGSGEYQRYYVLDAK